MDIQQQVACSASTCGSTLEEAMKMAEDLEKIYKS